MQGQAGASDNCVGLEVEARWGVGASLFSHGPAGYQLGSISTSRQVYMSSINSVSEWPKMEAIDVTICILLPVFSFT